MKGAALSTWAIFFSVMAIILLGIMVGILYGPIVRGGTNEIELTNKQNTLCANYKRLDFDCNGEASSDVVPEDGQDRQIFLNNFNTLKEEIENTCRQLTGYASCDNRQCCSNPPCQEVCTSCIRECCSLLCS